MALVIALNPIAEFDAIPDASVINFKHANLIFDSSYPSGGYAVTPSRFGFTTKIYDITTTPAGFAKNQYLAQYDTVKATIRVFTVPSGAGAWTEVTATNSLLGVIIRAVALGY